MPDESILSINPQEKFDEKEIRRIMHAFRKKLRQFPLNKLAEGIPTLLTGARDEYSSQFNTD